MPGSGGEPDARRFEGLRPDSSDGRRRGRDQGEQAASRGGRRVTTGQVDTLRGVPPRSRALPLRRAAARPDQGERKRRIRPPGLRLSGRATVRRDRSRGTSWWCCSTASTGTCSAATAARSSTRRTSIGWPPVGPLHQPPHRLAAVHAGPPRPAGRRARLPVAAVGLDRGLGGRHHHAAAPQAGISTMLVSDHPHLFETGGENYHTDFGAWDYLRGHEDDPWRTRPDPSWIGAPALPARRPPWERGYDTSRTWFNDEADFPGPQTMAAAADWLDGELRPSGARTSAPCWWSTSSIRTSPSTRPSRGPAATTPTGRASGSSGRPTRGARSSPGSPTARASTCAASTAPSSR